MAIFALKIIGIIVVSYLIGNINFADIISRFNGKDIRKQGSGNPGTMNMFRTFGFKVAILTLVADVLKGVIPTIVAYYVMQFGPVYGTSVSSSAPAVLGYYMDSVGKLAMYLAGLSAILGHIFPVFKKFKGGKGVGTALGLFFAVNPLLMLVIFVIAVVYLVFGKYGSVASFICVMSMTAIEVTLGVFFEDSLAAILLVLAVMLLILWAHRKNIVKLMNGTESVSNIRDKFRSRKNKAAEPPEATGAVDKPPPAEAETADETPSEASGAREDMPPAESGPADGTRVSVQPTGPTAVTPRNKRLQN